VSFSKASRKLLRTDDRDNTGELDYEEFRRAVRKGGKVTTWELPDIQLRKLFATVDADGGGSVSIEELKDFVWGGETEPEPEPQRAAPSAGSGSASARRAQWLAGCWLHWVAPGEGALARNEHGAKTLGVIAHGPDGNGEVILLLVSTATVCHHTVVS